ncbi:UDP-N-acetylmuramate--L-alanine ligase [Candidatus Woesebacteria bacterium]|nr:UDP-N-acetylmuramate--L-alanine ligase [Candidatus Woesebacteria bacterium]
MNLNLNTINSVHFIGIGGIGVSAIAHLMQLNGKRVSGSDMADSPVIERLRNKGIKISIGHNAYNITKETDLVIYSIAVKDTNPEIIEAKEKSITLLSYPQALSSLSKNLQTIAISGTHGKTTTTAMLANVLMAAQFNPTVIVGSFMKNYDSNLLVSKSDYFLVEACEYRRSFLNLYPKILAITNVDEDHLDYYHDIADIQSAFRELALRIPKDGLIVCNVDDEKVKPIISGLQCTVIDYMEFANVDINLQFPGEHNRQNAAICVAIAQFLGINKEITYKALESFSGTWRRFELKGTTNSGTLIYDDYAHHPKEIESTLSGMKEAHQDKRRVVFFQPHLYSRTKTLLKEFSKAFTDADEVNILPIYASRESLDTTINSEILVKMIGKKAFYIDSFEEAAKKIEILDNTDAAILMGAGNIYKLSELVVKAI